MRLVECTPLSDYYAGIFQETAHRNTTENTVNHRDGGVGLVIANQRGGGGNSVTVTRLSMFHPHVLNMWNKCLPHVGYETAHAPYECVGILCSYCYQMGNKNPSSTNMPPIWEMLADMCQVVTTWVPYSFF